MDTQRRSLWFSFSRFSPYSLFASARQLRIGLLGSALALAGYQDTIKPGGFTIRELLTKVSPKVASAKDGAVPMSPGAHVRISSWASASPATRIRGRLGRSGRLTNTGTIDSNLLHLEDYAGDACNVNLYWSFNVSAAREA
jgi:hypothetical protein